MATPLSSLSKYGGVLMAVLCVLLMVSFLVGDAMQYGGGGGGGSGRENRVVAKWRGGNLNERQLDQAVQHRAVLAAFQQAVFEIGTRDAREDGVEDLGLRVQPLVLPRTREEGVESDVVRTRIFAERARKAGMVVSDKMIADYLRAIGRDRVSNEQMRTILSRMNAGRGATATIAFVFDLLREAMLANNYVTSHAFAFRTILPEERWSDWKKVNERVVVEAAPVATADFIDEAPEPTDAELEEIFALYRDREPMTDFLRGYGGVELPSPLPAFATPPRVKLAFLRSDFNVALEAAENEVTDEDVAKFYEENKESFVEADRALFGDDGDEDSTESTDTAADVTAPEAEAPAAETPEPEADNPEADDSMASDAPADEQAASPEDAENPLRSEDGDLPGEETEEEEEEEEEKDATEEADYQPLDEVADEIRRRLAVELASRRIVAKMEALLNTLEDDFFEYEDAVERAAVAKAEPPTPPESLTNLKPLAEREALELVEMDQASQMDLRATEVGASRNTSTSDPSALPVWALAFRQREPLKRYEPVLSRDAAGNHFLALVTERYEAARPTLESVRDDVVAAWKRSKAAELALAKAEELAAKATEAGCSLTDFLAELDSAPVKPEAVVETDAFALLTIGPVAPNARQVPLRLSQPEPLVAPGPELLERVFTLKAGEVAAALNHDHSIAYLLRIAEKIGVEDELRREFIRDGDRWVGGDALTQTRHNNKALALVGNLLEESGLEWERTPDELR